MRKVDDGEEKRKEKKKEKIMTFIVATNVVASRQPELRPTGTPHARANCRDVSWEQFFQMKIGNSFLHNAC